jgi:hypothetical protein
MSATAFYLKGYFYFTELILGLSALKFLIVAFQFMEVKKAHILWKIAIITIAIIIPGAITIIIFLRA